jgi:hypothetical protein
MIRVLIVVCAVLLLAIAVCEASRRPQPGPRGQRRLEPPKGGRRA